MSSTPKTPDALAARVKELSEDLAETWLWEQTLQDMKSLGIELCRNGLRRSCKGCKGDGDARFHEPPNRDFYDMLVALHAEEFVVPCETPQEVIPEDFWDFVFESRGLPSRVPGTPWRHVHAAVAAFLARDGVVTVDFNIKMNMTVTMLPPHVLEMQRVQQPLGVKRWAGYLKRKYEA